MGSIESVEKKKEGHCYSLNRSNLNIEKITLSTRSSSQGNIYEMKKRSAKVLSKKMSDQEVTEKNESSDEVVLKKDNECELIKKVEEEEKEEMNDGDKVEASETDENEVSVERNKAKKQKESLGSGDFKDGETNDDCLVEESKNQGKDPKKGSQKKGNKKTKKGKGKKERDDEDNASDEDYEVEKILEAITLKNGKKEYLIQWKGFSCEYNSWEPEANLDCEDLIKEYFEENEKAMSKSCEEETEESEGSNKRRSKSSETGKKSTGRKRRLSEGKVKQNQKQLRSNRSKVAKKGDSTAEQRESTNRVTRSSRVKKTNDRAMGHRGKREEESEVSLPGRSLRGKSRKSEKDQNKENFGDDEDKLDRESDSEDSCDSGVEAAEYEVEKIVNVRRLGNGSREFLIKWKGFSSKDNSWEPEKHLNCHEKVKIFLQGLRQNSSARELRFDRKKTERFNLQSQRNQRKLSSRLEKMPRVSYKEMD